MNARTIFLTGTGALAKAIVDTVSFSALEHLQIFIYSRQLAGSSWLATIGNTRSRFRGNGQQYFSKQIDWNNPAMLEGELNTHQPGLVIHTASLQSMWDLKKDTQWSRLVKSTGYGTTLPLQCKLGLFVGRAIANATAQPQFINCCYPDAVNHVLKQSGLQVLCGIGNIGIIEQLLLNNKQLPGELLMIANHFHVQELTKPLEERSGVRPWLPGKTKAEAEAWNKVFDNLLISNEPSLNSITALTCLNLLTTLITDVNAVLHLPGPKGLVGGYPVFFEQGEINYIGTKQKDQQEEIQENTSIMEFEGLKLGHERVEFSASTASAIHQYSPTLSQGFDFSETNSYIEEFILLKERLSV